MSQKSYHIGVIIVGYRNPEDVRDCLTALALATPSPSFDIYICENGGKAAFQELSALLTTAQGPCNTSPDTRATPEYFSSDKFLEVKCLALKGRSTLVWTACASHNLGYAGAINAWISRLQNSADWDGLWILNPDTKPYPNALAKLVDRSVVGNKGMVSSTLVPDAARDRIHNQGLRWDKLLSRTISIGNNRPVGAPYDLNAIEAVMDSPSGASMYVTRTCYEHLGPMDERFFLYCEDIDWGMRAKKYGLGCAVESIVPHEGGTTIGKSTNRRRSRSWLSVYLESRNRLLFVRKHFPWRLTVGCAAAIGYAFLYLGAGSPSNFKAAFQGIFAAWNGETGPPPEPGHSHLRAIFSNIPSALYRKLIIAISLVYYCGQVVWRAGLSLVGAAPEPRLVILYYHGVGNSYRFEFARQMDVLLRRAAVVPADFQGALPSKKINVAITFDDAFVSVADSALPELARRSFHSTIFVPVGVIGRKPSWHVDTASMIADEVVMTAEQLKGLSKTLVTVGSHGICHLHLSRIDGERAKFEIEQSRLQLQDIVDREVDQFAFPYGDLNKDLAKLCKSAGYSHIYTAQPGSNYVERSEFMRSRVKADPSDGQIEFFLKINGAYNWSSAIRAFVQRIRGRTPSVAARVDLE